MMRINSRILADLFGFPKLREIAKDLQLVAVKRIEEKSELIDIILLKLGFEIRY